jgi:hypothetical protein
MRHLKAAAKLTYDADGLIKVTTKKKTTNKAQIIAIG